jgi:enterochelin esterase-like enzyme
MENRMSPGAAPGPPTWIVRSAVWLCAAVGWLVVGLSAVPAAAAAPPEPVPALEDALPLAGAPRLGPASLLVPAPLPGPPDLPSRTHAPDPEEATAVGPPAVPETFIPMSELFTADRLERLYGGGLPEARGAWREVSFYSSALDRNDSYLVWLPPGYDASSRRYPTLYLLHGVGGDAGVGVEEWLGYALTEDLDRMLAAGLIEPLIVVLPNGEQSYWINHADGGPRWADFVAFDLVDHVDATFRTEPARERRAIGGLSMGGHGALQLALNHPDRFAIAGAHSPTLRPFETSPGYFGDPSWFARYDPLSLVRASDAATRITTWIDVGYDDPWRPAAERLRAAQADRGAPPEFHVLEGEHEGWYWQLYLPEYLSFYSSALGATATTPTGAPLVASRPITSAPAVAHS